MSSKNKKRSSLDNFLWYCSGLNIRELSSLSQTKSNYFGIGGVNIFTTFLIFLLSTWSFSIAFPMVYSPICIIVGLTISFLVFVFNRQTISTLSVADSRNNRRFSLALFPIILFSLFISLLISTPIKLFLFNIPFNTNLILSIRELYNSTNNEISYTILSWSISILITLLLLLPTLIKFFTLQTNFRKERSSLLNELMWFCSGANKEILRQCPNDYSKYFGIGGTILFTALMASLSGGYAFFTAFQSAGLAICFGIFWGAMIFNLDRFIVNTMYTDNKHTISGLEILSGLPRIIIAIFLGIVISYPLELKIFEDSIEAEMNIMQKEAKIANDSINHIQFADITLKENNKLNIQASMQQKKNEIKAALDDWQSIEKIKSTCYSAPDEKGYRKPYICMVWPPSYKVKEAYYNNLVILNNKEINSLANDIESLTNNISNLTDTKNVSDSVSVKTINSLTKFSARSEAFTRLKADPHHKSIGTMSLFIMILLIIIEIAPVFFKMMLSSGDYDEILESQKNAIKVKETVKISQINDWANTEITKMVEENKKKIAEKQNELNTELASNEELLRSIAKAQSEIAQVAIQKWKDKEIEKAENNPGNIIQ